jgi:RNA polymerase subunit RPABC4/transcription elongation factor Spt4
MTSSLPLLSAFSSVHDVFHSTGFVVARNVAVFLAVVFWLGLVFWVYKDARRRVDDPWLVAIATLVGLVPYVGPLVYLLFRPAETLADRAARRAEMRALEGHLDRGRRACPVCSARVEADYLVCPVCTTRLRQACPHCEAPLEPLWQMCPYCAHPAGRSDADLDAALTAEARELAVSANGSDPRPAEGWS